jgi:hypothetical protein
VSLILCLSSLFWLLSVHVAFIHEHILALCLSSELFIYVSDALCHYALVLNYLFMCRMPYVLFIGLYLALHAFSQFVCYFAVALQYKVVSFFSGKMASWICVGPIEVFPRALWGGSFVRLKCFCCSSSHNTYLVSH